MEHGLKALVEELLAGFIIKLWSVLHWFCCNWQQSQSSPEQEQSSFVQS
jgi:hypothetical protein